MLKIDEAARRLGLSPWTLRTWIAKKMIDYVRVGSRAIRIPERAVEEVVEKGLRRAEG